MTPASELYVYDKQTGVAYVVYDITYDKSGYPHFLIFKDGQWLRRSAKHFTPHAMIDPEAQMESYTELLLHAGLLGNGGTS